MYQTGTGSLCEDFIAKAKQTWKRIKISRLCGMNILEETITDINLMDLQINHPNEIKTQRFSKPEEGKIGADWEWWLGSEDFWLPLRVQAKIVDPTTLKYPHLDYKSPKSPQSQIELLIKHSLNDKPPKIPVYVFYNYWDINNFDPPWLCNGYSKAVEMLGCGLSEALSVKKTLDQGSNEVKDIASIMYPWSCLVCCKGFSTENGKLPFRAFDFFLGAFRKRIKETDFPWYEKEEFVRKGAPSYVYKILEGVKLSEDEWKKIEVNRITVAYEREYQRQKSNSSSFVFRK